MLTPRIKTALRFCPDLPTPPAIAMQIVELARNPEVDLSVLVEILAKDPALAGSLMRASNSCLFARRRKSESLRQAIVVIGLNATMTLALSFSLAQTLKRGGDAARAIEQSWRRVLIASCAARLIGGRLGRSDNEELALAALLQDIGILALRAALGDEYQAVLDQAHDHDDLVRLERDCLGTDHGEAGSWLMAHWKFTDKLVQVPVCVHGAAAEATGAEHREFFAVIDVAAKVADLLLGEDTSRLTRDLMESAGQIESLDQAFMESVLTEMGERLADTAELYDTEIISPQLLTGIIDQARQALTDREFMVSREADEYERQVAGQDTFKTRSADQDNRDRAPSAEQLDARLDLEFRRSTALGRPLSLAFVRLDQHADLVKQHGPNDIAAVVAKLRRRLAALAGHEQLVFSSGADEFIVLLPGFSRTQTRNQLDRLRGAIAGEDFCDADEEVFRVTISIGMSCHMDESQLYDRAIELLGAADQALRGLADSGGGNCLTMVC